MRSHYINNGLITVAEEANSLRIVGLRDNHMDLRPSVESVKLQKMKVMFCKTTLTTLIFSRLSCSFVVSSEI
jgi:hypothetical protein